MKEDQLAEGGLRALRQFLINADIEAGDATVAALLRRIEDALVDRSRAKALASAARQNLTTGSPRCPGTPYDGQTGTEGFSIREDIAEALRFFQSSFAIAD